MHFISSHPLIKYWSWYSTLLEFLLSVYGSKGKYFPITYHAGTQGEQRYSSSLSLTSALEQGAWSGPCCGCFTPMKEPIIHERGWTSGLVWMGAENFAPIGVWTPDYPACSGFLYRLCSSSPSVHGCIVLIFSILSFGGCICCACPL